MYLKIRDSVKDVWIYIDDFNRLEASPSKKFNPDKNTEIETVNDLKPILMRADEEVAHAAITVFDPKLMLKNLQDARPIEYQVIRCIKDISDDEETYFDIAFNTVAFVCSDRGHTMDRFIIHKVF